MNVVFILLQLLNSVVVDLILGICIHTHRLYIMVSLFAPVIYVIYIYIIICIIYINVIYMNLILYVCYIYILYLHILLYYIYIYYMYIIYMYNIYIIFPLFGVQSFNIVFFLIDILSMMNTKWLLSKVS